MTTGMYFGKIALVLLVVALGTWGLFLMPGADWAAIHPVMAKVLVVSLAGAFVVGIVGIFFDRHKWLAITVTVAVPVILAIA